MAKPEVETAEHQKAFSLYLSMGADRSTARVAQECGKSKSAIDNWSSAFGWSERVIEAEKRISEKALAKTESDLAKHQNQMVSISDKLTKIFLFQIDGVFNDDGSINPERVEAFRPRPSDVKLWAELKGDILARAAGSVVGPSPVNAEAAEMMGVEVVERFIIERTTRLATARKRDASSGGFFGVGTSPGDT